MSFPTLTESTPVTVSGATLASTVDGVSTLTAQTPPVAAVTEREARVFFVAGSGGVLYWSVAVAPAGGMSLSAQAQVLFTDDDAAQVGRVVGPVKVGTAAVVLSVRARVPRLAVAATLRVASTAGNAGGSWTEESVRLYQVAAEAPYVPPLRDLEFGVVSPNGVAAPAASAGLPAGEALSPARRSPQVRYAQRIDSIRPDLLGKRNAREV